MARVALAFLWHHHQPYYPDDLSGENPMPWVRLHGVKDYYGMGAILEEIPELRCTINFVPSLLVQLQALADGRLPDKPLTLSRKSAADLSAAEVAFILDNFFLANREVMIRPFARYEELWQKRGAGRLPAERAAKRFQERDLRDLQVWANLAWFHPVVIERDEELKALVAKGRHFTEEEKHRLLDRQMALVRQIVPQHSRLQERGQVELTTTPFYHPILPLLWDKHLAREALPDVPLPTTAQSYPEDAAMQVRRAVEYHRTVFGRAPRGMWPSEGSVCQALIPILAEAGLHWIATDEEILYRSLAGRVSRDASGHVRHPELLYRPWRLAEGSARLQIVFRDHALSDLIGFQYQRVDYRTAVDDFIGKVEAIGRAVAAPEVLVSVILDGENCWEYYPNQGLAFLRELYRRVAGHRHIRPVRIGDYLAEHPAEETIERLFAGSWISHNFSIWIGHPEDNRAWELLHWAREALKRTAGRPEANLPEERLRRAWEEIYIAEGSDWFWWFGDDHSSAQDALFDQLFRTHLKNVYRLLGQAPPAELDEPIHKGDGRPIYTTPRAFLKVTLDGRRTFFEWLTAGHYHCRTRRGTMAMVAETLLKDLYFGFDLDHLYVRLDTEGRASDRLRDVEQIRVAFTRPAGQEVHLDLEAGRVRSLTRWSAGVQATPSGCQAALDQIVELAVPFQALGVAPGEPVRFFVEVIANGISRDRVPEEGAIELQAPTEHFEEIMWQA